MIVIKFFKTTVSARKRAVYFDAIYNLLDAKIYTATLTPKENNTIDVSHLSAGYYMAKLENGSHTATLKLVKK